MPKESFEQFVKRQEKKLDKAEKMVKEVEKRLKTEEAEKKIEEYIEKSVKELKKLWKENEDKIRKKEYGSEIFSFFSSLPLPEIPSFLLERTSNKFLNKFLKEFDWKKFEGKEDFETYLGLFLSAFLNKNIENYVLSQKRKGIKEENIKPIEVHLKVKELPIRLDYLGYQNPKKLHLIIKGDCEHGTGEYMQGGKIIVEGNCGNWAGAIMQGGKIVIEGNCGDSIGYEMKKGEIIVEGNCGNWIGEYMQGGKIIVERNCRRWTGKNMQGGELNIKGEVKSFDKSAFSSNNKGTIIWKNTKTWENGNWTKEGKEMWEKGEIPVEG